MAVNARAVVVVCTIVSILVWIIGIAGMAAITSDCNKDFSGASCARGLQYEWWGLWFHFFLMLCVLVVAIRDRLVIHQLTFLAFLSICTSVLMWSARSIMAEGSFADLVSNRNAAKNAAAAGFVLCCLANFLLIILFGSGNKLEGSAGGNGYGSDHQAGMMSATPAHLHAYQPQV